MTDTEAKRLDLYNRLQEVLGTDPATLLTKEEFAGFKNESRQSRSEVNQRFDRLLLALVGGCLRCSP